jgi:hypothetical protein
VERQAARLATSQARDARKEACAAETARVEAEAIRQAAEDVARKATAEAEKAAQEVALVAERKSARDARYAAAEGQAAVNFPAGSRPASPLSNGAAVLIQRAEAINCAMPYQPNITAAKLPFGRRTQIGSPSSRLPRLVPARLQFACDQPCCHVDRDHRHPGAEPS